MFIELPVLIKMLNELESYHVVAEYFKLSKEQREDPQAGKYLLERLKNIETSNRLFKELRSAQSDFPTPQPSTLPQLTTSDLLTKDE